MPPKPITPQRPHPWRPHRRFDAERRRRRERRTGRRRGRWRTGGPFGRRRVGDQRVTVEGRHDGPDQRVGVVCVRRLDDRRGHRRGVGQRQLVGPTRQARLGRTRTGLAHRWSMVVRAFLRDAVVNRALAGGLGSTASSTVADGLDGLDRGLNIETGSGCGSGCNADRRTADLGSRRTRRQRRTRAQRRGHLRMDRRRALCSRARPAIRGSRRVRRIGPRSEHRVRPVDRRARRRGDPAGTRPARRGRSSIRPSPSRSRDG